jgi:hypothetical protein
MVLCRFSHSAADDLAHRQTSELAPGDGEAGGPEDEGGGESATGVPPLKEKHKLAIVLDLPAPLSVNRTRRIDYRSMPAPKAWRDKADALFLVQKRKLLRSTDHLRRSSLSTQRPASISTTASSS